MLEIKKKIVLEGMSIIDNNVAEKYLATIYEDEPENIDFSVTPIMKTVANNNRTLCDEDKNEFYEKAYALQEEIKSEEN